jgi:D-3-phosphoglycerate dehydrogenase
MSGEQAAAVSLPLEAAPAREPEPLRFRVVVADPISASGLAPLVDDARIEVVERLGLKGNDLARALEDADAVIVRSASRITRDALRYATRLRLIGRAGVGVDNIDVEAATERGIAVLNAPSGNTVSAAELAFALLLALVRRLPAADRSMKAGEWDRKSFGGIELYGKTLGLVGAGRIGTAVAQRARAFGMRVVAYDPYLSAARARELEIELAPLDAVLERSDVISLHVPLTDATRNLIGEAQLRRMKQNAFLVNAARGGVVNEAALYRALTEGWIAGAALDVFEQEPPPADHPLRSLPNVVLTPHLGAATLEAQENVAIEIADAVRAALLEGDLSRAVNAPAIAGEAMQRMRPLLDLGERLGRLIHVLADGPVRRVDVRYSGVVEQALRPLTANALVGMLEPAVGKGGVNLVNAIHLAHSRGITVGSTQLGRHPDHGEYIEIEAATATGYALAAGALLDAAHPRIVRIGQYRVDVRPRGALLVLRNRDVPGVIGKVGTLLGEAGANIAEYHQARLVQGGEALAAISIDDWLQDDVLNRLRGVPEILDVRQVDLD